MLKLFAQRIAALFAFPLLLFTAPAEARSPHASGATQVGTPAATHPALWKVSDADTTIYLFGTIHLLPHNYKWRTAAFDHAIDQSQQLVVETIVDPAHLLPYVTALHQLGFSPGLPPIEQRVPAAKRGRLLAAIARSGAAKSQFDQMKTWNAAITLLQLQFKDMGLKGEEGPETTLREQFTAASKPVDQLETIVEQFGYFDRLPEKDQRALLEGAVEPQTAAVKQFDGMLTPWSSGDVAGVALAFNRELSGSPEIKKSLLVLRNANWAKWIERRLAQPGTIMVAVGAGHLAGNDSVLALLKRDGVVIQRLQ